MRKLILVLLVLAVASPLFAQQLSDTVVVLVTPAVNLSLSIDDGTDEVQFGTIDLGVTTMNSTAVDVENDGNVRAYWEIRQQANFQGWTIVSSSYAVLGDNEFRIAAITTADAAGMPDMYADFDLSLSSVQITAVAGGDDLLYGAYELIPGTKKDLYFRLEMPNTVSGTGAINEKSATMYLTASVD